MVPLRDARPLLLSQVWRRSQPVSYLLAILLTGISVFLKLIFLPPGTGAPALFLFAAIILSAWLGGLGPGLLAAFLSALTFNYAFIPPYETLTLEPHGIFQASVLFLEGALISLLANARRRAKRHAHQEAERALEAEGKISSHERLNRAILDSLTAHIAVLDREGNIVTVNESWETFSATHPDCSLPRPGTQENYLDSIRENPDRFGREILQGISAVLQGERKKFNIEYSCRTPDLELWFLLTVTPFSIENSSIQGVVTSHFDITERRQLELERAQLFKREVAALEIAEEANRSKDEFLAVISHELRTPLNAILGWTQLLTSGQLDEPISRQGLEAIERSVQNQARLVNNLLDVSRIVTRKMELDPAPLQLREIIETVIRDLEPMASEKQIRVRAHFHSDPTIQGDAYRLHQVFWNLLHNAIKFSSSDQDILLHLERTNGLAQITIIDQGSGVPPEFLPHLFRRFRQSDTSASRRHGGLGLGLSISDYLVQLHNGTLNAHSNGPDQGATFTVKIPLHE